MVALITVWHASVAVKGRFRTLVIGCLAQIVEKVLIREGLTVVLVISINTAAFIVKLGLTQDRVFSDFLTIS